MITWFSTLDYSIQALLAGCFTALVTSLGAGIVIFFKKVNKTILDAMLGFAGGVMIAASFWSLLSPGIEMAENLGMTSWLVVLIGFMVGGILLFTSDKIFEKLDEKSSIKCENNTFKRCLMLITSITIHNIPEGLAVGVAFGSLGFGLDSTTLNSALMLAVGIGLQNFPEGSAVSIPLRREGLSRTKSFILGSLSGIVEPISAVIGAILVLSVRSLLPYLLAFAAGAMIYVVVQELIPESQTNKNRSLISIFTLIGFSVMMVMDVGLG